MKVEYTIRLAGRGTKMFVVQRDDGSRSWKMYCTGMYNQYKKVPYPDDRVERDKWITARQCFDCFGAWLCS